jgi:hypothetical protein
MTKTVKTTGCVSCKFACFLYFINNQLTQNLPMKIIPNNVPKMIWNRCEFPTQITSVRSPGSSSWPVDEFIDGDDSVDSVSADSSRRRSLSIAPPLPLTLKLLFRQLSRSCGKLLRRSTIILLQGSETDPNCDVVVAVGAVVKDASVVLLHLPVMILRAATAAATAAQRRCRRSCGRR